LSDKEFEERVEFHMMMGRTEDAAIAQVLWEEENEE